MLRVRDLGLRLRGRPARPRAAARRLMLSGLVGLVVLGAGFALGGRWPVDVSIGWDAAAYLFLAATWHHVQRFDAEATRRSARRDDPSRATTDAILLGASLASLIAVAFVLSESSSEHGMTRGGSIALAVATIVAGWASVHAIYMLRYARLYYADPVGGIDFNSDDQPDYHDMLYLALTIGMTFQVSDTDLNAREIRRTAIRHALLSYLFGAVIIATTINIVATLASTGG